MKHIVLIFCSLMLDMIMASCDKDEDNEISYSKYDSLFSTVSIFVTKLDSNSSYSYPINGSAKKNTSDYKFEVKPIGRLIGITPKKSMTKSEITEVKEAHDWKFGHKYVVKDIYLNNGGGVTIDC